MPTAARLAGRAAAAAAVDGLVSTRASAPTASSAAGAEGADAETSKALAAALAMPKGPREAAVEAALIGIAAEQGVERSVVQHPKPWRLRTAEERREFFESRRVQRRAELERRPPPTVFAVKPRPKPMTSRDPRVFRDLRDVLGIWSGGPHHSRSAEEGHSERSYQLFVDLVERMLEWDPAVRIKPMEALNHPFLREDIEARATTSDSSKQ